MPVNARLCLVPFVGSYPAAQSCFSINGEADVVLSTDQYGSIILLPEESMAQYSTFLSNPAATAPSRALFLW